jgi:predicted esterase
MRRFPRGRLTLLLAGLLVALVPATVRAEPAKAQKVLIETFDKVQLQGSWYPSGGEATKSPCVILLHKIGGNREQKGWESLAQQLQEKGFAVLSFDFRGHGDSRTIKPEFWNFRSNTNGIKGGGNPKKESIDWKEFSPAYLPMLVNDISAAKLYVEQKNNARECNAADIYIVGAEDGASLGLTWMATEWNRRKRYIGMNGLPVFNPEPEAKDLAGLVCLSIRPMIGTGSAAARLPTNSLWKETKMRELPLCLFYGQEDKETASFAATIYDKILTAERSKLKLTFRFEVQKAKLTGHELLDKRGSLWSKGKVDDTGLTVEELIVRFGDKVKESRAAKAWGERDVGAEGKINLNPLLPVNLQSLGITVP